MSENNRILNQAIQQTRSAIMHTPEMREHVDRWGFSFFRSGVLVVRETARGREYLCVEDALVRVDGKFQNVHGIWNLPAGSCKNSEESRQATAVREVYEETGYAIELTDFLFVTSKADADDPYTMNVYVGRCVDGTSIADFNRDEIYSVRWMTAFEIERLNKQNKLRSPHFMLGAVRRYEKGLVLPLSYAVDR